MPAPQPPAAPDADDAPPERIGVSPAVGPVPPILVAESPTYATTTRVLWHAAIRAGRSAGSWVGRNVASFMTRHGWRTAWTTTQSTSPHHPFKGDQEMPVTRIAIREGKSPEYKQALMDEIYEAMRETVAIKDGDRFMAITEHGSHEFAYGAFLDIDRSDDLVQIQVFWAPGKSVDAKLSMYRKIVERLGCKPGVRPEDVLISVVEAPAENWSFGNGTAQFYRPA